jgi:hypothetical protein
MEVSVYIGGWVSECVHQRDSASDKVKCEVSVKYDLCKYRQRESVCVCVCVMYVCVKQTRRSTTDGREDNHLYHIQGTYQ